VNAAREQALQRSATGWYRDPDQKPPDDGLEKHQLWAWMQGADPPHWEIVGTGLIYDGPIPPLRELFRELDESQVQVKFWVCPDHPGGHVAWIGRVAACREDGCPRTNEE